MAQLLGFIKRLLVRDQAMHERLKEMLHGHPLGTELAEELIADGSLDFQVEGDSITRVCRGHRRISSSKEVLGDIIFHL
jgi:hypothetical protein